jgi:alkyl sulfatase BDS1-like metallo-beta-lactamase superfamily hydrolase
MGRAVPLALAAALIALPAAANDATPAAQATKTKTSQVSLRQVAAREASRTPLARTTDARRAEQGTAGKESSGFFKSRAGAVALAVMVIGTGYAVYSVKHDRITSPAKK